MKVVLESTEKIVTLETEQGGTIDARIWEGFSVTGQPIHAYIVRVAADEKGDLWEFERDLKECRKPSFAVAQIPARLIL